MSAQTVSGLVRAARPRQWLKNVLVFAAPAAGGRLLEWYVFLGAALAFVSFCLAASGTYLLNDAADVEADRQHPRKRLRPVASGTVSVRLARFVGVVLTLAGLGVACLAGALPALVVGAYLVVTFAYTYRLKHVPVIELGVLASGFVLRAVAGGHASSTRLSVWFLVVVSAASLMMATGKRTAELSQPGAHRKVLAAYTPAFLTSVRTGAFAAAATAYCLWAFTDFEGRAAFAELSIVPFTFALMQFMLRAERGETGEPEKVVVTDCTIVVLGLLWAITFAAAVVGHSA